MENAEKDNHHNAICNKLYYVQYYVVLWSMYYVHKYIWLCTYEYVSMYFAVPGGWTMYNLLAEVSH